MEAAPLYLAGLAAVSFFAAWLGIRLLLPRLRSRLDMPNERSNHTIPTPRGGGIAVVGVALPLLIAAHLPGAVALSAGVLALVSWRDDTRALSPSLRLICQFLAVVFAWPALHNHMHTHPLPLWAEVPLTVLLWMWFTNLYNFMDGIDGITAAETVSIPLGILAVYIAAPAFLLTLAGQGVILAAAAAAFWWFNRSPARIFLGDVGSIPLGFLMAWLLFILAGKGFCAAALILPAYYLADSGITLLRRLVRRENILKAHSGHFYQRAVAGGRSHTEVVKYIMLLNLLLIIFAVISTQGAVAAFLSLFAAYGLTGALLCYFSKPVKPRQE